MYIWATNVKVIASITEMLIEIPIYLSFYSTIRKKLLGCVYRDHLETEETLENQNSEPGTNLQNKILQFREEYLLNHSQAYYDICRDLPWIKSLRLISVYDIHSGIS